MPHLKEIIAAVAIVVIACSEPCHAQAPAAAEYDVKAAFIYNFAKFVEWPDGTFNDSQSQIVLCAYGKNNVETAFNAIRGKQARGRTVVVRFNDEIDDLKSCNIIYISSSDKRRAASVLESVRGMSILTIGETPDFVQHGGVISFTSKENKIRFEINPQAALLMLHGSAVQTP